MNRDPELEQLAAKMHLADLPFHNFDRTMRSLEVASTLIQRCHDEGIRVDSQVVYLALLFRNTGFGKDVLAGDQSAESIAAARAGETLREAGFAERTIDKVAQAILATNRFGQFNTTEQKVTRAAELSMLAAPFPDFLRDVRALWQEHGILSNETLDWPAWQQRMAEAVRFFLSQEIRLTSYFHDVEGQSVFHAQVAANLNQLVALDSPEFPGQ